MREIIEKDMFIVCLFFFFLPSFLPSITIPKGSESIWLKSGVFAFAKISFDLSENVSGSMQQLTQYS
jgi:hypothetical protein